MKIHSLYNRTQRYVGRARLNLRHQASQPQTVTTSALTPAFVVAAAARPLVSAIASGMAALVVPATGKLFAESVGTREHASLTLSHRIFNARLDHEDSHAVCTFWGGAIGIFSSMALKMSSASIALSLASLLSMGVGLREIREAFTDACDPRSPYNPRNDLEELHYDGFVA